MNPPGEPSFLPANRYGSGMPPQFGPLYHIGGASLAFRRLRMEDHSVERVRKASELGPVVYALHTPSRLDWLALARVLLDRKLPLPIYTHGLGASVFGSLQSIFQHYADRFQQGTPPDALSSGWWADAIAMGRPTCFFLAEPPDPLTWLGLKAPLADPLAALEAAQAKSQRPIQVLPVVVLWERSRPEGAVAEFVAGLEAIPGPLARLWSLANASDPLVQVGEPVSVAEFMGRYEREPEGRRRKMLRLLLRRYLYREAQVVLGPRTRSWEEVRRQVLTSPEIAKVVAEEAGIQNTTLEVMGRKVAATYDRMAARVSARALRPVLWLGRQIWKRIYSGIDIREEDLERIREALRAGTPVLIPCHRSHLDYMLLTSILHDHDVAIPHIVAGDNLAFWPLGAFFRRMGAFFIRRSFKGDRLFPAIFARYLTELLRMEVPIEFFIEGGRSRTGKLLPPKLGVLSMIFDAASRIRPDRRLSILPIYIGYARLAEEKVFGRELSGAPKEPESMRGVVRATRVLAERYGRVYVRVAEPLDVVKEAGAWQELSKEARQEKLMRAGNTILSRIDAETLILPVALTSLAVLAHGRRGVRHSDLEARASRFLNYLRLEQVKEPPGLKPLGALLEEAVRVMVAGRLLEQHEGDGGRVYSIVPSRRIRLEYYKNSLLSPLATVSWYAAAIRALGQDIVDHRAVEALFVRQFQVFRQEFIFPPELSALEAQEQARQKLLRWGLLMPEAEGLRVRDRSHIGELANLTTKFLESYLLVLRAMDKDPRGDHAKTALTLGKTLLAVDELSRPESLNLQNLQNAAAVLREHPEKSAIKADLLLLLEGKA